MFSNSALLTYLGSQWVLVIIVILAVAIVGTIAFFLKNWKLAVLTATLVCLGLAYQHAVTTGIKIQMAKDAQDQIKAKDAQISTLNNRIQTLNLAAAEDAARAAEDAQRISELEEKANDTPPNDGPGLPRDAARRVRGIR